MFVKKEAEGLARLKQVTTMLTATTSTGLKSGFLERGVDVNLSRDACKSADHDALKKLESIFDLPVSVIAD